MKNTLIVGRTEDEILRVELETEQEYNKENHLSLCGTSIEDEFFNDEQGDEKARDNLDSCEDYLEKEQIVQFWEMGKKKEDYIEEVLNTDGWQHVLGDVEEIGDLYSIIVSGGQHQPKLKEFVKIYIKEDDLKFIWVMWNKYHLKDIKKIPKEKLDRLKEIFKEQTNFNDFINLDSEWYAQQVENARS